MYYNKIRFLLCSLLACVMFSSCYQDIENIQDIKGVQATPEFALPLLDAKIGISDLFNRIKDNEFLVRRDEGNNVKSFKFIYATKDSLEQRQFITVPPIAVNYSLNVDAATAFAFNNVGSFSNSLSNYAVVATENGEKLKQLFIKQGSFSFTVSCDIKHSTSIVFVYPTITRNGKALTDTLKLTYANGDPSPIVVTRNVSLDGYTVDLTDNGISYNVIPYLFQLDLKKINGNPPAAAGDKITIIQELKIDEYRGISGYLGNFSILNTTDETSLESMFKDSPKASLKLKDPKVRFRIASGIGIPITGRIMNIALVNEAGEVPIVINQFKDTFTVPSPAFIGQYVMQDYVIDKTNSNIDQVINTVFQTAPKAIKYSVDFSANYNGIERDNFIFDTSSLKVTSEFELPLDFALENYERADTQALSLPSADDVEPESIYILTQSTNTMPLTTKLQMYFLHQDSLTKAYTLIDSLYKDQVLSLGGAKVDDNGTVLSPSVINKSSFISKELYNKLSEKDVNFYITRLSFETPKSSVPGSSTRPFVKLYSNQGLQLKMGLKAKAKVQTKFKGGK